MKEKPFVITNVATGQTRLIKAASKAKLADFILKDSFQIKPAKAEDLMRAMEQGISMETIDAGDATDDATKASAGDTEE